jgi:hypothetical protein
VRATATPTPTPFDPKSTAASLELDHLWIVVSQGAPERAVLERAGLAPSPTVNRHDGQGTASITFDDLRCELRGDRVLMAGHAVDYLEGEIEVDTGRGIP